MRCGKNNSISNQTDGSNSKTFVKSFLFFVFGHCIYHFNFYINSMDRKSRFYVYKNWGLFQYGIYFVKTEAFFNRICKIVGKFVTLYLMRFKLTIRWLHHFYQPTMLKAFKLFLNFLSWNFSNVSFL